MSCKKRKYTKTDTEVVESKYFVKNRHDNPVTEERKFNPEERLPATFYQKSCVDLCRALLGQYIVRNFDDGSQVCAKIVETEAYCGIEDACSHSYQGRRTNRTEAMFMPPGTLYVYTIYGMYDCMNISSWGEGAAVLLRALEPVSGLQKMHELRSTKKNSGSLKDKQLCNGPSKLCQALDIKKTTFNKEDLPTSNRLWLTKGEVISEKEISDSKRINITGDAAWVNKLLRFYITDNTFVSVKSSKPKVKK